MPIIKEYDLNLTRVPIISQGIFLNLGVLESGGFSTLACKPLRPKYAVERDSDPPRSSTR